MTQKPMLLRTLAILFFGLCPLPLLSQEAKPQNAISKELEELFKADQAERDDAFLDQTPEKMGALIMRDARRRERVVQIVTKEVLSSAEDYHHAAMVLQHGDKPEEFLMAHELATVAAFKGHKQGPWLSASALDRFLQSIGRPQRFGTQFSRKDEAPWTQEPYDRSMNDSIRKEYGAHTLAEQAKHLEEMNSKKEH